MCDCVSPATQVTIPSTLLPARSPQAAAAYELGLEREMIAATASDGGNSAGSGEMDSAADGAIAYITEFMSNIKVGGGHGYLVAVWSPNPG